jgi:magnesium-transporting ATPase (P-type)
MVLGAFLMIILQILFTTTYIFQKAFKTVNLSMYEWSITIFFSILLLLIIEFEKMIIRNTGRKKGSV